MPSALLLLLLAIFAVCASARTVPQWGSLWNHVMHAWAPSNSAQQQIKRPVSGYTVYNEATGSFGFTSEAPDNGEIAIQAAQAYNMCLHMSSRSAVLLDWAVMRVLQCLLQVQHLLMPVTL